MALDDAGICNFRRLDSQLTTSGQPSEAQLVEIRDAGIGTVVNLALSDSPGALPDETASLAALGLRYIHIPVQFDAPTEADFTRFCETLEELGDTPVHIHCAANYRVSAFLYRYRVERLGWTTEQAGADLLPIWEPNEIWRRFMNSRQG